MERKKERKNERKNLSKKKKKKKESVMQMFFKGPNPASFCLFSFFSHIARTNIAQI